MAQRVRRNLRRPAIGVTGNNKKFSPSWFCIRLILWLCGGQPIRITVDQTVDLNRLDGLVISGGDDIDPALYGDKAQEGTYYDRQRDALEMQCIKHGLQTGLPLLGICRGHQLINTVMGGTLHASIRSMRQKTSNRWTLLPKKRVFLEATSNLYRQLGKSEILVNSLHNQAIAEVGVKLKKVGFDADNIIQAVEAEDCRPILGVQWHPEYLFFVPAQLRIFRWLVNRCRISAKTNG